MPNRITWPRHVARATTIALWAVGSAYLLRHELQSTSPDWVVVFATPIVWGVILTLPVLSTYARRDRQWMATALLWLAALVGSVYTLNATISRQSASRDAAVIGAEATAKQRETLQLAIDVEKLRRQEALARCGTGRVCHDSTTRLIGMHQLEIERLERQLASLTVAAPQAGEQRIAALLSLVFRMDLTFAGDLVGLLAPCLLGITLEIAALASAMYGWHPERQRFPAKANVENAENATFSAANDAAPMATHPVIEALARAGRPVSNHELAQLMGVCDPESTKRRREVAGNLREWRDGRCVMISLA